MCPEGVVLADGSPRATSPTEGREKKEIILRNLTTLKHRVRARLQLAYEEAQFCVRFLISNGYREGLRNQLGLSSFKVYPHRCPVPCCYISRLFPTFSVVFIMIVHLRCTFGELARHRRYCNRYYTFVVRVSIEYCINVSRERRCLVNRA